MDKANRLKPPRLQWNRAGPSRRTATGALGVQAASGTAKGHSQHWKRRGLPNGLGCVAEVAGLLEAM